MANIAIPTQEEPLGECTCPNCGRVVKLKVSKAWLKFFASLQTLVNEGL